MLKSIISEIFSFGNFVIIVIFVEGVYSADDFFESALS